MTDMNAKKWMNFGSIFVVNFKFDRSFNMAQNGPNSHKIASNSTIMNAMIKIF